MTPLPTVWRTFSKNNLSFYMHTNRFHNVFMFLLKTKNVKKIPEGELDGRAEEGGGAVNEGIF